MSAGGHFSYMDPAIAPEFTGYFDQAFPTYTGDGTFGLDLLQGFVDGIRIRREQQSPIRSLESRSRLLPSGLGSWGTGSRGLAALSRSKSQTCRHGVREPAIPGERMGERMGQHM
jgi:hypothetical protein